MGYREINFRKMLRNKRSRNRNIRRGRPKFLSILQYQKDKIANDYWWSDMMGRNFPQSEEAFYIGANTKYGKREMKVKR